jgi:beta-lactamase class A
VLTADLQRLGLLDSFMAGYFDQEVEPPVVRTPANQRTDINTKPDPFMQTTPADMAALLTMLYQCAQHGGGGLAVAFAGEVTRAECDAVIELLSRNKTATLIEAGVPEGTTVAHKHGFGSGDTIADAGIVFSPGGDYVVVIYLWHPVYLEWEQSAPMVANISRMVYIYFNP